MRKVAVGVYVGLLILAVPFSPVAVTASAARVISVNLSEDPGGNNMATNDLAGAPAVRVDHWNNYGPTTGLFGDVLYDDGGLVGGSFAVNIALSGGGFSDRGHPAGDFENDPQMFRSVIDDSSATGAVTTVVGIPFAVYDVYVYMRDDGSQRVGTFTIGSQTFYARGGTGIPDGTGAGYVLSADSSPGTSDVDFDPGNYVKITGLTNSTFSLVTGAIDLGSLARNKWCGFQIVESATGAATDLFLGEPVPGLLTGNPANHQLTVFAELDTGTNIDVTVSLDTAYSSTDTNVFTVSSSGQIGPEAAGTADLVVDYHGVSITQAVEVLAPMTVRVTLDPTHLLIGVAEQAGIEADFATVSNVNVLAFDFVSLGGGPASVVDVSTDGLITPAGVGVFSLTGTYAGVTGILDPAGEVTEAAPSTSFGVSFADTASNTYDAEMEPGDIAGAVVRAGNWNNLIENEVPLMGNFLTLSDLIGDTGIPLAGTTVGVDLNGGAGINERVNNANLVNESTLYNGVIDAFPADTFIVVSNVPYAVYDVYVYMRDDGADRAGYFSVEGTTYYARGGAGNPADGGTGYIQSADTDPGSVDADIDQGNYVLFSGLTSPTLNLTIGAYNTSAGADRNKVVGFQVVKKASGIATNLYLAAPVPPLLSGNPTGYQPSVFAEVEGAAVNVTVDDATSYTGTDGNIFTVSSTGLIDPHHAGSADLVIGYQDLSITQAVEVLAPNTVRLSLTPSNLWVGALGGADPAAQAQLLADFATQSNVNVTAFEYVSFSGSPTSVVDVAANGMVSPVGEGAFSLSGTYAGLTDSLPEAGMVSVFTAPMLPGGATALNIDIAAANSIMNFRDLSGAPGVRGANWNALVVGGNAGFIAELVDSNGQAVPGTAVDVVCSAIGGASYVRTPPTPTANESVMISSIIDQGNQADGATADGTLVVSGIPYNRYDLYCYVWNDAGATNRPGYFATGGVTNWIRSSAGGNPANDGSNYIEAVTTIQPTAIAEVPTGNYVKFTGLTAAYQVINFAAVAPNLIPDADGGAPRLKVSGLQIVDTTVGLEVAGFERQGADLVVRWTSASGDTYAVSAAATLAPPDWTVIASNLPATPPENAMPVTPGGDVGFLRVEVEKTGPVLNEGFESGAAGWTQESVSGTSWALGAPSAVGPATAHGGSTCWGTSLSGNYVDDTDAYLRSPVIDLTGLAGAALAFWQYIDSEPPGADHWDYGTVNVIDTGTPPNVIATLLTHIDGAGRIWEPVSVELPPEALGQPIRIEFFFQSDESFSDYPGWYIDDITVE